MAQGPDIVSVHRGADSRVAVRLSGRADAYYLLLRGPSLGSMRQPVAAILGGGGPVELTERDAQPFASGFYRVAEHPVDAPDDSDADGMDDVAELRSGRDPLDPDDALPALTRIESSPRRGEGGVSVTRETILRFSRPLGASVVLDTNSLSAMAGGRGILSRTELSPDRRLATLFYLEPLPGASRVRVRIDGDRLVDAQGDRVDADGDGVAGGTGEIVFDTLATVAVPATGVVGHVFKSERGPNGENLPLVGVTVTVDGAEQTLRAVTDSTGFFRLMPCPAGRFFVHVDGRTAAGSAWPGGDYYPFVGKAWEAEAGRSDTPAAGTGEIFLPRVAAGTLTALSPSAETAVIFSPAVLAENPDLAGVQLRVPPNALYNDNGTRGGMVGIVPVPPDRLPEPLPPGLNLPLVITVQTDGSQNFSQPVPVRFPNRPDPVTGLALPPGAKSALWSFNHDLGTWEVVGPMTVSADGRFVDTDPGVGLRQPGWHGTASGSSGSSDGPGGGGGGGCPTCGGGPCIGPGCGPDDPNRRKCPPDPIDAYKQRVLCFIGTGAGVGGCLLGDLVKDILDPCELFDNFVKAKLCGRVENLILPDSKACVKKVVSDGKECLNFYINCFLGGLGGNRAGNARSLQLAQAPGASVFPAFDRVDAYAVAVSSFLAELESQLVLDDQAWNLLAQLRTPEDLTAAREAQLLGWNGQIRQLRGGLDKAAYFRQRLALLDAFAAELTARLQLNDPSTELTEAGYYVLENLETGTVQRGRTGIGGGLATLVLAPETRYLLRRYFPRAGAMNEVLFVSRSTGQSTLIPRGTAHPIEAPDTDGDGLPDLAEFVAGTDAQRADTDADGVNDGIEVRDGTSPLQDSPLALGLIGSMGTRGEALAVDLSDDLAVVADGSAGLAVFSVARASSPMHLAQLPIGGRAIHISADKSLVAVALASASGTPAGVVLVDIGQPDAPRELLRHAISTEAPTAVLVRGRRVFAGTASGRLVELSPDVGLVAEYTVPGGIHALAIHGEALCILTSGELRLHSLADPGSLIGRVSVFGGPAPAEDGRRLAVDEGLAYVGYITGYSIVDLSNPAAPVVVGSPRFPQSSVHDLKVDGAKGLVAVTSFGNASTLRLSLYDVRTATNVTRFLLSYDTPGDARAVAVRGELAYVADTLAGVQVIRLKPRDTGTNGPTVTLFGSFRGSPPTVEAGSEYQLTARARDDFGVRAVEFQVNGRRVAEDRSPPYEVTLVAPPATVEAGRITVRARAVDTAGNAGWSDEITVGVTEDVTPPVVRSVSPPNQSFVSSTSALRIGAVFSEPVDIRTLARGVALTGAGPDRVHGTADDVTLPFEPELDGTSLRLRSSRISDPEVQVVLRTNITDLAGHPLAAERRWRFSLNLPSVVQVHPTSFSLAPGSVGEVRILFDGAMDPASLASAFSLRNVGVDGRPGTADDLVRVPARIGFTPGTNLLVLGFTPPLQSGQWTARIGQPAADAVGLPLRSPFEWNFQIGSPDVAGVSPANGFTVGENALGEVAIQFTADMDPSTLAGALTLTNVGPDLRLGGVDDTAVTGYGLDYNAATRVVRIVFPAALAAGEYRLTLRRTALGRFGDPLLRDFTSDFGVHGGIEWAVDRGGGWDVATNWTPVRPLSGDVVRIVRPGQSFTTQFQGRDLTLRSLVSAHALDLRNSTLGLLEGSVISNSLAFSGGTLSNATSLGVLGTVGGPGSVRILGPGVLDVAGGFDLHSGARFDSALVRNGGLARLDGAFVALTGAWINDAGAELRFASGTSGLGGGDMASFLNLGRIRKESSRNELMQVTTTNRGVVEVVAGTLVLLGFAADEGGRVDVAPGATLRMSSPGNPNRTAVSTGSVFNIGGLWSVTSFQATNFLGRLILAGTNDQTGSNIRLVRPLEFAGGLLRLDQSTLFLDDGATSGDGVIELYNNSTLEVGADTTLRRLGPVSGRLQGRGVMTVVEPFRPGGPNPSGSSSLTLGGSVLLRPTGGLELPDSLSLNDQSVLEVYGDPAWRGTGNLQLQQSSQLHIMPSATLRLSGSRPVIGAGNSPVPEVFPVVFNEGRLERGGDAETIRFLPLLRNEGVLAVTAGALILNRGGPLGGSVEIAAGARLALEDSSQFGGARDFEVSAVITGGGTLVCNGARGVVFGRAITGPALEIPSTLNANISIRFAAAQTLGDVTFLGGGLIADEPVEVTNRFIVGTTVVLGGRGVIRNSGHAEMSGPVMTNDFENAGQILWTRYSPSVARTFRNLPGASFNVTNDASGFLADAFLRERQTARGTWDNSGRFFRTGTGRAVWTQAFTNRGVVDLDGRFAPTAGYVQTAAGLTLLRPAGVLELADGTQLDGVLRGDGQLDLEALNLNPTQRRARNVGRIEPGDGVGRLTVRGDLTQLEAGTLSVDLGGPVAGIGHDQLEVTGTAILGGRLEISTLPGFQPALGQRFQVLKVGNKSASRFTAQISALAPGPNLRWRINGLADGWELEVVAGP